MRIGIRRCPRSWHRPRSPGTDSQSSTQARTLIEIEWWIVVTVGTLVELARRQRRMVYDIGYSHACIPEHCHGCDYEFGMQSPMYDSSTKASCDFRIDARRTVAGLVF